GGRGERRRLVVGSGASSPTADAAHNQSAEEDKPSLQHQFLGCRVHSPLLYGQAVPHWHRPINSPSISCVAAPIPTRAARLFEQSDLLDLHPSVRRFHHVVDGEQGDRHRRERLHFHARPPDRLRGGPPPPRSSANTAATSCGFTFPCARPRASSTRAIASTTFSVSPPARARSRSRSSSPSSMSANPPRAWKGCRPSANSYRRTGPA